MAGNRRRRTRLRDGLRVLGLLLTGERRRAAPVYELLGEEVHLGERTRYLNLGYWNGASSHDEASDALAEQLGLAAGLREGDTVVDAGFGFGDQDDYWLRRFRPARIIGLNITPLHVEAARRRFPDPRLDFRQGSATAMELPDGCADRVTALECAFHFSTRADFFREAFRVLRPGGSLATADVLPRDGRHTLATRLFTRLTRAFWQMPPENWYGIDVYRRVLDAAGFVEVDVHSVREQVIPPFWEATRRSAASRRMAGPWYRPLRLAARAPLRWFDGLDYVLASARKPAVGREDTAPLPNLRG